MAADVIVPPATLSRWGMPNEQHHSQLSDQTTLAASCQWMMRMQSLNIFLEIKKNPNNTTTKPPLTNPFDTAFSSLLPTKEEGSTYARPVIIQLGVGSETPGSHPGLLCCQWVTVKSLNCISREDVKPLKA